MPHAASLMMASLKTTAVMPAYNVDLSTPRDRPCTVCYTLNAYNNINCDYCNVLLPKFNPDHLTQDLPIHCDELLAHIYKECMVYKPEPVLSLKDQLALDAGEEGQEKLSRAEQRQKDARAASAAKACERELSAAEKFSLYRSCVKTLSGVLGNITSHPNEAMYRRLNTTSNPTWLATCAKIPSCNYFLASLGFVKKVRKPLGDPKRPQRIDDTPAPTTFMVLPSVVPVEASTTDVQVAASCLAYEIHVFYPRFKRKKHLNNLFTTDDDAALASRSGRAIKNIMDGAMWRNPTPKGDLEFITGPFALNCSHALYSFSTVNGLQARINPACITEVHLGDNQLQTMTGLTELTSLQYLNLSGNRLRDKEAKNVNFPKLRYLNMAKNMLTKVPHLGKCTLLEVLWLTKNKIVDIHPKPGYPNALEGCKRLWIIDFAYNLITFANPSIMEFALAFFGGEFPSLSDIRFAGNEFVFVVPTYRVWLLKFLPQITVLDGKLVTSREKTATPGGGWMQHTDHTDPHDEDDVRNGMNEQFLHSEESADELLERQKLAVEGRRQAESLVAQAAREELEKKIAAGTVMPKNWIKKERGHGHEGKFFTSKNPEAHDIVAPAAPLQLEPLCMGLEPNELAKMHTPPGEECGFQHGDTPYFYNKSTKEVFFSRIQFRKRTVLGWSSMASETRYVPSDDWGKNTPLQEETFSEDEADEEPAKTDAAGGDCELVHAAMKSLNPGMIDKAMQQRAGKAMQAGLISA